MKNLTRIFVIIILAVIAGSAIFLVTWDIPAPIAEVEIVIPNERFPR